MQQALIQFKNVTKSFGNNKVLDRVCFDIFEGEIISIIGKSGVGKSVLLKHIIGLLKPDSGEIWFKNSLLSQMKKQDRHKVKKKFSYMFQANALFDSMTVFENIALPLKEKTNFSPNNIRKKVENMMEQLDLGNIGIKYPSQLSGGMGKRVALARALITNPEIVLFDEPTTGLDPIRKISVHKMISEYKKKFGFTGVVVSHELPDIFDISQRVAMMDNGSIIFEGTPEQIKKSSNLAVRKMLDVKL